MSSVERNSIARSPAASGKRFLAIQSVVLLVLCGLGASHYRTTHSQRTIPKFRNQPRVIRSNSDLPLAITDEQLAAVLHKLRPRLNQAQPKINFVDHALRMWGDEVEFDDPSCLSGSEMRQLLVDHRTFAKRWGKKERPLIIHDERGVSWRTQQGLSLIHI